MFVYTYIRVCVVCSVYIQCRSIFVCVLQMHVYNLYGALTCVETESYGGCMQVHAEKPVDINVSLEGFNTCEVLAA